MKEKVKEFYLITDGNGNYTHDDTLEEVKKNKIN